MKFSGSVGNASAPAVSNPSAAAPADTDPHNGCRAEHLHTADGITVALTGSPVWLDGRLLAQPAAAVHAAYRARGRGFLAGLAGRFSLAVVDWADSSALLAVDRMGIERVVYAAGGDGLAFGDSVEQVRALAGGSARLRAQSLFDYLLLHMVPAPDTVYEGILKLRAGTCASYRLGRLTVERYWTPEFRETRSDSVASLSSELHASLASAVRDCGIDQQTGSFLSGGLDSSTVTGVLANVGGRPPQTFSIGFGVDEFNELEYARIANAHFGGVAHEYNVTADDIVDAIPKIAATYDEPFGNSSAVPTFFCAKLAASHGVRHLLAGDGGDEIFGGNERYARQRIFEAYHALPTALRNGVVEPLTAHISPTNPIMPLRKLRSYVDQARIPLPERLESWNFIYRTNLDQMLDPEFRAMIDPRAPLRVMAGVFSSAPAKSLLNRMMFYDWQYTLSDNDLRKVGSMCSLAGVRVSYPMLDPRVVDVSTRVPSRVKMRRLELRSFYKRAMRGFLPEQVLSKHKHGFGLPFGVWLKSHARLAELVYGLLSDLKRRGIVTPHSSTI